MAQKSELRIGTRETINYSLLTIKKNYIMALKVKAVESIKIREKIIRDFYREWKEQNPSQRKYNVS